MKAYCAFVKKEFLEYARTYKLLAAVVVFLLFGMLNPITAKIMPEFLASYMPDGMVITLSAPGPLDSWIQFYKNMTGMQLIIFVILFSGIIAGELSGGTLINMLTKGLSRRTVILAKFTSVSAVWTLSFFLCFGTTLGYTMYLLPGELPNLFFAAFCMWLFGILLTAVMLLGGVLCANIYGTLLVTGGFVVSLMLLNFVPTLQKLNPCRLAADNTALLTGAAEILEFAAPIGVCCGLAALAVTGALAGFDRRKV